MDTVIFCRNLEKWNYEDQMIFFRATNLFSHMHPTLVAEKEIVSLTSLSKIDGLYLLCAMSELDSKETV